VIVIPGEAFGPGGAGFLRISYAAHDDDIRKGVRRFATSFRPRNPWGFPRRPSRPRGDRLLDAVGEVPECGAQRRVVVPVLFEILVDRADVILVAAGRSARAASTRVSRSGAFKAFFSGAERGASDLASDAAAMGRSSRGPSIITFSR
jgi:hypothetical protein